MLAQERKALHRELYLAFKKLLICLFIYLRSLIVRVKAKT